MWIFFVPLLFSGIFFFCDAAKPITRVWPQSLSSAKIEEGSAIAESGGLRLAPATRISFKEGSAYGLGNGVLRVAMTPPKIDKSLVPILAKRLECFCAFSIYIGRTVVEVSDRGVRAYLIDEKYYRIEKVFSENVMNMIPDGSPVEIVITIEDKRLDVKVNSQSLLQCPVTLYDFSAIQLSTFGHPFLVDYLSIEEKHKLELIVDAPKRSIDIGAVFHPRHFNQGGGLHNHHFITWEGGKAAPQALITTFAPDSTIHDALVSVGALPGNNLLADAWTQRLNAKSVEPDKRAEGDVLHITILYGGEEFPVEKILKDLSGAEYDFRFAGNRNFIPIWKSGCVACLQSCPGSKIANRTYTMRDLARKKANFRAIEGLPFNDGDEIVVRITK